MTGWFLFTSSLLASSVEMVEVLTILLATGITRGWRSTLIGTTAAGLVLGALVVVFGAALTAMINLAYLRLLVGFLLLVFGLQWLRKAVLRYAGLKALHDEELIYAREVSALSAFAPVREGMDWTGFTVAFKGVLLEGLEVVFIVLTFGSAAGQDVESSRANVQLAAAGALMALVLVGLVGLIAHRPLARVPENTMKFVVGLMLVAFGAFWAGEGIGIEWPLEDAAILLLLIGFGLVAWMQVLWLRRRVLRKAAPA